MTSRRLYQGEGWPSIRDALAALLGRRRPPPMRRDDWAVPAALLEVLG